PHAPMKHTLPGWRTQFASATSWTRRPVRGGTRRSRFGQLVVLASGRRTGPIRHGRAGAVDHRPSAEVVVVVAAAHHQARRIVAACVLETTTNRAA
ncbi:MAG TPA: hypothetical protein PLC22_03765, partial [Gordonia sp. (in: high G+C Gram-positive bacteria)]|nr:hypothetical protein [Gordonia sp. (in: high G+C Gram-positive bacteria)]